MVSSRYALAGLLCRFRDAGSVSTSPHRMRAVRIATLVLLAAIGLVALANRAVSAAPGSLLLPNLRPLPAGELRIEPSGGRRLLRFSMVTQNFGSGPLELRASAGPLPVASAAYRVRLPLASLRGRTEDLPRTAVRQRIYLEGGGFQERPAGDFVFHAAHDHVHFEDFVLYELIKVAEGSASPLPSSKVTFCVLDYAPAVPAVSGAPARPVYGPCAPAGGIADSVQGLSVGWGDYYDSTTPGQELDVTALPDGLYALRTTADPANRLLESDEADNVSEVRVRLAEGALAPP
jgi:hypothetical protein